MYSFALPPVGQRAAKMVLTKTASGFEVTILDAKGKVVTGGSNEVTFNVVSVPKGVSGAGQAVTATVVDGVADFDDVLTLSAKGKYEFSATDWGLGTVRFKIVQKDSKEH